MNSIPPVARDNPMPTQSIPSNYGVETQQRYHPEYWLYVVLVIVAIVLAFKGGHQVIAQYQAATGAVLTHADIASVQDGDIDTTQAVIRIVLTDNGVSKFASAKPNSPIYFKGNEIGAIDTIAGKIVSFHVPVRDAAKIKLQLAWKDQ